jgi:antitoxin MazE
MQISRWGNSLAVRLPKALVDQLGLKVGDALEIVPAKAGELTIAKNTGREVALKRIAERAWELPPGYKSDRAEANER